MPPCQSPRQALTALLVLDDSPRQALTYFGETDSPRQALTELQWIADSPRQALTALVNAEFYKVFVEPDPEVLKTIPHGFRAGADSPRQALTPLEWHDESPRQSLTLLEV